MNKKTLISMLRLFGYNMLHIPTDGPVEGWASASQDGGLYITIVGRGDDLELMRVIAHEMGHHAHKHTIQYTSSPLWHQELEAEKWALDFLALFLPKLDVLALECNSRSYLKPFIKAYLDEGITTHGEQQAMKWLQGEQRLVSKQIKNPPAHRPLKGFI